jgi:hypothetical protein
LKKELLPLDAEERLKKIKRAVRGDDSYIHYTEHMLMETYSIGYNELMAFPYDKYLEFSKIISQENKEEKKRAERQEREMQRKT